MAHKQHFSVTALTKVAGAPSWLCLIWIRSKLFFVTARPEIWAQRSQGD